MSLIAKGLNEKDDYKNNFSYLEDCDEIHQFKIVYCGPKGSGKTKSFKYVIDRFKNHLLSNYSIETTTGTTIYQDSAYLAFDLSTINSKRYIIIQVVTCPGANKFSYFKEMIIGNADGVIFVSDSDPKKINKNIQSFRETLLVIDNKKTHIVIQLNKRDLHDVIPTTKLRKKLNLSNKDNSIENYPLIYPSIATKGKNVISCFLDLMFKILSNKITDNFEFNELNIELERSLWIKFKKPQNPVKIYNIINEKFKLENYNTVSPKDYFFERYSQDSGYTFYNKEILRSFVKIKETNYNEPLIWDCIYSKVIKTFGEAIIYLFGINLEKNGVGRDLKIWNMGFTQYYPNTLKEIRFRLLILEAERRLLYNILKKIKKVLELNWIESELNL